MIEIVPAILRATFEKIAEDWQKIHTAAEHIQIDITDGIFAGDGSFRELRRFKQLPEARKIELHLMVHTPGNFVDDIVDLNPARVVFHIESFAGSNDIDFIYKKLRAATQAELALAINPPSPTPWLEEHLALIDYVMFMGYHPGWANQPLAEGVYNKIDDFHKQHPDIRIAVDGHVGKETIPHFVAAGATILCANTSIFGKGNPVENMRQLQLLAEAVVS
jgi:ribulose-phosphate 3-epimerase